MLLIESFPVGAFQCNCTILACPETKEALVVDPGGDTERILEVVRHYGLTVRAAVHTHAHLDHIAGTRDIKEATGCTIHLHPDDMFLYDGFAMQAAMFGWVVRDVLPVDEELRHEGQLLFGKRTAQVLHTPGHTPGSVCFQVADERAPLLLAGDTLFKRSIGRTDLWGGNFDLEIKSIKDKLLPLPDATRVIAGHGPDTTILEERESNPFLTT